MNPFGEFTEKLKSFYLLLKENRSRIEALEKENEMLKKTNEEGISQLKDLTINNPNFKRSMLKMEKERRIEEILGESHLQDYLQITIPSTKDVSRPMSENDFKEIVNRVNKILTKKFGGSTIFPNLRGSYYSEDRNLVIKEPIVLAKSNCNFNNKDDLKKLKEINDFVQDLCREMGQECILLQRGSEDSYFIESKKEEMREKEKVRDEPFNVKLSNNNTQDGRGSARINYN
jgi:hypothetical protein